MGKKDAQTVEYLSESKYFADMFNAALFCGEEVIKESELLETDKERKNTTAIKGAEVRHDNVKKWMNGTNLAILVIEDQSNVDYHMVIRNLYADGLHYHNQWKKMQSRHRKEKDLKKSHEFISGMKKDEKFQPVVNLVVYFGEEPWQGPRTLYKLLDFGGENEKLRPYINDYKLNLFDYHDYDSFEQFHSELRIIFEFLRYAKDKEALRKVVAGNSENYYNVSNETYEMIAVLTNSVELLVKDKRYENEEGGWNMCKALEDIRLEGIEQGIEQGIERKTHQIVENMLRRGMAEEDIAALAACDLQMVLDVKACLYN